MAAFEYRQAEEIRAAFARHRAKDRESLPRLEAFRTYWRQRQR
jgi:hypothetical protein